MPLAESIFIEFLLNTASGRQTLITL